jgi:serine/threonine protein kinase
MHERGVMHGDLYAHNILWNPASGDALLSDFGAATLMPMGQTSLAHALQALEVRAFGCLLEELADRAMADGVHYDQALTDLLSAANTCLQLDPAQRPTMAQMEGVLRGLMQ